jgi:hypothetical protein
MLIIKVCREVAILNKNNLIDVAFFILIAYQ